MENCFKCNRNLDNENKFICKECHLIYCITCFMNDEHIKTNINNLNIKNNKCPIHEKELINYCLDCKKLLCIYCIKQNEHHLNHSYESIEDMMPSIYKINQLRDKINKKKLAYEELKNLLDEWIKELIKKIEKLKQNLEKEIELLEKLFYNFNQNFINYTYYYNFHDLNNYINNFNSEKLHKFCMSVNFEEKTKNLFDFLCPYNNKLIQQNFYLENPNYIGNGIISKISDTLFFTYNEALKNIEINNYNNNKSILQFSNKIKFYHLIYSVSSSKIDNLIYIYVCLMKSKKIKIFIYNIEDDIIKISDEEIKDEIDENNNGDNISDSNSFILDIFTKCIQLTNQLIASSDNNNNIYIWQKNNNSKGYINIKKLDLYYYINDLLLVNDEYLICSHSESKKITFFNFKELKKEKILDNIECVDSQNSLFIIHQYILINCDKGITIISLKTKEVVQFIEILKGIWEKKICFDNYKNIYILNYYNSLNIMKYKFIDGCLIEINECNQKYKLKKKNKEIDLNNHSYDSYSQDSIYDDEIINEKNKLNIICINEEDIILWNKNIYILKKDN